MPDIEDETRVDADDPILDPPLVDPADSPEPAPTEPTLEQKLQEERDGRIRAEERARIAETRPPVLAPPAPTLQPVMTADQVNQDYRDGKISDDERIQALVQLETEKAIVRRNQQDAIARNRSLLVQYMNQYPDLNNPNSPRLQKVSAEMRELVSRGHDPEDVRTQVLAVERVVGKSVAVTDDREFHRRGIPVGGVGSGAADRGDGGGNKPQKRKGEAIWDRLNTEAKQFYRDYHRDNMTAIYETLDFADESLLMRRGRFTH